MKCELAISDVCAARRMCSVCSAFVQHMTYVQHICTAYVQRIHAVYVTYTPHPQFKKNVGEVRSAQNKCKSSIRQYHERVSYYKPRDEEEKKIISNNVSSAEKSAPLIKLQYFLCFPLSPQRLSCTFLKAVKFNKTKS